MNEQNFYNPNENGKNFGQQTFDGQQAYGNGQPNNFGQQTFGNGGQQAFNGGQYNENIQYGAPVAPSIEPMSIGSWVGSLIVTAIPVVGLIMLCIWAFSGSSTAERSNWAKATLVLRVILFAVFFIIGFVGGFAAALAV